jgi:hypothetical protein
MSTKPVDCARPTCSGKTQVRDTCDKVSGHLDKQSTSEGASMRLPIRLLFLIAAAGLLGEIQAASAQSAYSYPWCSKSPRGGSISCRYTSYEQCRQSNFGGICIQSPYYQGMPAKAAVQPRSYRRG